MEQYPTNAHRSPVNIHHGVGTSLEGVMEERPSTEQPVKVIIAKK